MSGIEDQHLDVLQNIEFAAVGVYRADRPPHDVDVQDAVGALVCRYHAEDGERHPPVRIPSHADHRSGLMATPQPVGSPVARSSI